MIGLLTLVDLMRANNVGKIVFSSSCATYGVPDQLPITEDAPQRPINPYGESKLIGEHIIRDYGRAYGIRSVALRYFNASGADREGELAERHDPETHLIPRALMAAAGTIPHLDVPATITIRQTERVFETISMWKISRKAICAHSPI